MGDDSQIAAKTRMAPPHQTTPAVGFQIALIAPPALVGSEQPFSHVSSGRRRRSSNLSPRSIAWDIVLYPLD
jgi:hypothetical protein